MPAKIEQKEVYERIITRRYDKIWKAIEEDDGVVPYKYSDFDQDMKSEGFIQTPRVRRDKWDAAVIDGIITVQGHGSFIAVAKIAEYMSVQDLLEYRKHTHTYTHTPPGRCVSSGNYDHYTILEDELR